jgi:hypothetical protein
MFQLAKRNSNRSNGWGMIGLRRKENHLLTAWLWARKTNWKIPVTTDMCTLFLFIVKIYKDENRVSKRQIKNFLKDSDPDK